MAQLVASEYFRRLSRLLDELEITDLAGNAISIDDASTMVAEMLLNLRVNQNKAMVIGNGGSAAIASHLQIDLANAVGVKAMVFNEPPMLTAFSNDYGYETVFEKPITLWSSPKDVLIAISSSGRSVNILKGVHASLSRKCSVVTLSGFKDDNPLRRMGHVNFYVRSTEYGYVELAHAVLTHYFSDAAKAHVRRTRFVAAVN